MKAFIYVKISLFYSIQKPQSLNLSFIFSSLSHSPKKNKSYKLDFYTHPLVHGAHGAHTPGGSGAGVGQTRAAPVLLSHINK